ncbi:YitT family protein [Streptomyces harbinensis]|uniref:membrane protein YczE n=1 Tax=Streptomyces harbinensis TaxID=1176198 RepID=UPI0037184982
MHRARRLVQLFVGLVLYGTACALLVRSELGTSPWDVLHQGVSRQTGVSMGTVSITVGALVLLLWIPLRERPGVGTVANVILVGLSLDAALRVVPEPAGLPARVALLAGGIVLLGAATGLYITARLGSGPRDGLMTGLHRVTGRSVRLVRTCIEVAVLAAGFLLGGTVGVGTAVFALTIGPVAQWFLRLFGRVFPSPSERMSDRISTRERQPGILRVRSHRTDRDHEPSCADAG